MLVDLRGTAYYIPRAYADYTEIIALCKVVAEYDGVFVVHQRRAESADFPIKAFRGRVR